MFALRDLFNDSPEQVDLNHALLKTFVEGYRSNKPLPDEDLALIPVFLRFHNLLSFTKIIRSLENLSLTNKAEWVQDLTEKLQSKINVYREGLEAT